MLGEVVGGLEEGDFVGDGEDFFEFGLGGEEFEDFRALFVEYAHD